MSNKELQEVSLGLLTNEEQHRNDGADEMEHSNFYRLSPYSSSRRGRLLGAVVYYFSLVLNVALFLSTVWLYNKNVALSSPLPPWPTTVYSPAESAIEYETVVFDTNLRADIESHKPNIYLELTDAGDAAWETLTEEYATSLIPLSQASRLPFTTATSPTNPDKYVTGLSVFHQLHCLNRIRKLLHPERYPWQWMANVSVSETIIHDNHCVDLIRQALMCNADISAIQWEVNEKLGVPLPSAKTVHTCRKWDGIMAWAAEHKGSVDW